MADRIYLSPPHLGTKEKELVIEALDSNWVAPVGPHLDAWEREICEVTGATSSCLLSSATAAIHLALRVLDVGPGDLVFIQSHTHIGSVNPIIYQGATPVFIDSEPGTWNMSPEHLERAIKEAINGDIHTRPLDHHTSGGQPQTTNGKPKAIIPVHLYGMPANLDAIMAIAKKYNLPVVEDAAESLGSTFRGKYTGTFGDLGVYSFNGNKIITTSGGGCLVSDKPNHIERAHFLATQARDEAPHFQHSEVGYNYRMSNILAAIGRGQMALLSTRVEARRANFDRYKLFFHEYNRNGFDIKFQQEGEFSFSNRWLTAIAIDPAKNNGLTSDYIRLKMESANIESRPLWKPMHLQPVFNSLPFFGSGLSEELFKQGLCMPSGSSLTDEDFERIFSVLNQCFMDFK